MDIGLALVYSFISGLIIMLGGWFFTIRGQWEKKFLDIFIALGAGYILAVALLDMIPESYEASPYSMFFVILGYLIVHLFEHVFTPHFHYGEETHEHLVSHVVSASALLGLLVHNFFSGVAIGSGMLKSESVGLMIFLGTILHKLPEGFTISSIMFVSHHRKRYSFFSTVSLALASLIGTLAVYCFNVPNLPIKDIALALSAGTFIHVATTDLIPRINDSEYRWMPLVIFLGVGMFFISSLIIHR
ncbi:ZIP family metal transporter [bacterium]|nr:ZIP family metal transporter [bacterium]